MTIKPLLVPIFAAALLALANFSPPSPGPCDSPLVGGHTGAPGETSCFCVMRAGRQSTRLLL